MQVNLHKTRFFDKYTEPTKVLDHGYVSVIDMWGSDEQVIEAARMSTNKGFLGWGDRGHADQCPRTGEALTKACPDCDATPGDEKLLKYLWENKHQTPFEMGGLTIEVQAPIFVFREWHRHRVPFGYNEMSARYTPLPDVNYIPTVDRLMVNAGGTNKQAGTVSGSAELSVETAKLFRDELASRYEAAETLYQWALKAGVPKELARIHLPVGRYSRMRATSNLRGWLAFLALRADSAAQFEIREYAFVVQDILSDAFPRTLELFRAGRGDRGRR
jgi:thymidylate synthase (FAD)